MGEKKSNLDTVENVHIYDIEVFKYNWLVVMYDRDRQKLLSFTNEQQKELRSYIVTQKPVLVGFNNKHYDDYILLGMLSGNSVELIKNHNDFIIGGGSGWEYSGIKGVYKKDWFRSFDLRDDLPKDLSLKAIEGNIGLDIRESSIDFTINRPLTPEEVEDNKRYCIADVMATNKLYELRSNYLEAKLKVAKAGGMDFVTALGLTNPKLSATFLKGKKLASPRVGELVYHVPKELRLNKYKKALEFYKEIDYEAELEIQAKDLTLKYGWGGLHGAIPNYSDSSTDDYKIVDIDVGSYYPSMMIQYGYAPDAIPSAKGYEDIYNQRLHAKHTGDSDTADALKLVLNSTYGALKNQYNVLFQPSKANHICITGQLFLTDLIEKLEDVPTCKIIQANTDGIMVGYGVKHEREINTIVLEWEQRTRLKMEYTEIKKLAAQKDVNNYIMIAGATYLVNPDYTKTFTKADKSKIEVRGGYASLYYGGSFKINSLGICHKAVVDYFIKGTPVAETVNSSETVSDFQIIAKTGSTYNGTVYRTKGHDKPVQKVNRVYASKNPEDGTLYKVKNTGEKIRYDKIADLPEHCIIDNANTVKLSDVDRSYYIDVATKWVTDYIGKDKKKRGKNMATRKTTAATPETTPESKPLNIYAKLAVSKAQFINSGVSKTGKNRYAGFKYFELGDIIPTANEILLDNNLLFYVSYTTDYAIGTLVDCDDPESRLVFTSPMRSLETLSQSGAIKMNAVQALGAEETYQRRYLYLMMLDIVENDTFDKKSGNENNDEPTETVTIKPSNEKKAAPKTAGERKAIAESIAKGDDVKPAGDLHKESIKKGLQKLRETGVDHEDFITKSVVKMRGDCSEAEALEILAKINELLYPEEG